MAPLPNRTNIALAVYGAPDDCSRAADWARPAWPVGRLPLSGADVTLLTQETKSRAEQAEKI